MVSTANYFLPRLLAQFRQEHPGIEIRLQVAGNREEIVTLLQQGDIELAVMGRPPQNWPTRAEPFAMHPHVLVTSIDHPFTHLEFVPARALSNEGFIVREPESGTRAALDEYMHTYQMKSRVVMQMSSNEAIKQAVMAGMGVALLSLHTLDWNSITTSLPCRRPRACLSCVVGMSSIIRQRRSRRRQKRSAISSSSAAKRTSPNSFRPLEFPPGRDGHLTFHRCGATSRCGAEPARTRCLSHNRALPFAARESRRRYRR